MTLQMNHAPVLAILNGNRDGQRLGVVDRGVRRRAGGVRQRVAGIRLYQREGDGRVAARDSRPGRVPCADPLAGAPTGMLRMAATGDIGSMLSRYSRLTHTPINLEFLAPTIARAVPGAMTIDVSKSDPASAIAAIVALDDRYGVTRAGVVFRVGPKSTPESARGARQESRQLHVRRRTDCLGDATSDLAHGRAANRQLGRGARQRRVGPATTCSSVSRRCAPRRSR